MHGNSWNAGQDNSVLDNLNIHRSGGRARGRLRDKPAVAGQSAKQFFGFVTRM
jgi:hypothetical protein